MNHVGLKADIVIRNGVIYTVDERNPYAEALAIKGDKITFVGNECDLNEYTDANTNVIDLKGGMALPGFVDCHIHPGSEVDMLYGVNLSGLKTVDNYINKIRNSLHRDPSVQAVFGMGWDNKVFDDNGPTKNLLDEISTAIPMLFFDEGTHSVWVNSKALELAGITKDTFLECDDIARYDNGEPSGHIKELGTFIVIKAFPPHTVKRCIAGIAAFQKMCLQYGLTTVIDACIYPEASLPYFPGVTSLVAYKNMSQEGTLKMRYRGSYVIDPTEGMDIQSFVAAAENYRTDSKHGTFALNSVKIYYDFWDELQMLNELRELCVALDKINFQLFFHALNKGAVSNTLDLIQQIETENGKRDSRHIIAHLGFVSNEDIIRMAKLGVVSVPLPAWFGLEKAYFGRTMEDMNSGTMDPMRSYFENGVVAASGSTYPAIILNPRPLEGIERGMTRLSLEEDYTEPPENEKATLNQMIQSFTLDGAKANFMEKEIGSLEVGKKADIVILDQDITKLDASNITRAKEVATIFDGKIVYAVGRETEG